MISRFFKLTKHNFPRYSLNNIRRFHHEIDSDNSAVIQRWKGLSEQDRLDYALAENNPPFAEVAYYKGLAFSQLEGHDSEAIQAFTTAGEMDPAGFAAQTKKKIADLYAGLGNFQKAYENCTQLCQIYESKLQREPTDNDNRLPTLCFRP
ncbi:MAG: hypothetical protein V4501_02025 [Pseudomonadota bacterium]